MRRRTALVLASAIVVSGAAGTGAVACGGGSTSEHGVVAVPSEAGGGALGSDDSGNPGTDAGDSDGAISGDDAAANDGAASPGNDSGTAAGAGDFGVHLINGGATFKVWAPDAATARVSTSAGASPAPMTSNGDGTYSATVPGVVAGTTFSYIFTTSGGSVTRIDPYCRELTADETRCVVTDPTKFAWSPLDGGGAFVPPARSAAVVYELHVGSYSAAGTFAGATAKLPDLVNLGINVIELMPVNPSAGGVGSWGYGPRHWMAPNTSYGTEDDLRTFVDTAHRSGIAVWLDVVMNHADPDESAPLDCYDAPCVDGDAATANAGLYFFPSGPYAFTPYGPRPNYSSDFVANMLLTSIARSIADDKISGFRWDSVSNIRAIDGSGTVPGGRDLLLAANAKVHALSAGAGGGISVAEDLKGDNDITSSDPATGFDFDAQWDGFGYAITPLLTSTSDSARNITTVESELTGSDNGDPFARLIFLEDHDTVGNGGSRLPSQIDPTNPTSLAARKRSILGGVLLMTTPGIPMIFMGEESLATGTFTDPAMTLATPTSEGLQVRTFFHDMIALRTSLPGLASASVAITHTNAAAHVLGYTRGTTLVVVNLANQAYTEYDVGVPNAGPWNVRLNTDSDAYGSDFGGGTTGSITARSGTKDGMPYTLPLVLGAYAAVVVTPP